MVQEGLSAPRIFLVEGAMTNDHLTAILAETAMGWGDGKARTLNLWAINCGPIPERPNRREACALTLEAVPSSPQNLQASRRTST